MEFSIWQLGIRLTIEERVGTGSTTHKPADVQLGGEVVFLDVKLLLVLQQTDYILQLHHLILTVSNIQLVANVQLTHL